MPVCGDNKNIQPMIAETGGITSGTISKTNTTANEVAAETPARKCDTDEESHDCRSDSEQRGRDQNRLQVREVEELTDSRRTVLKRNDLEIDDRAEDHQAQEDGEQWPCGFSKQLRGSRWTRTGHKLHLLAPVSAMYEHMCAMCHKVSIQVSLGATLRHPSK